MRIGAVIGITVVLVTALIMGGVSYNAYLNRNKEHVYSSEEIFSNECSKRGGNPTTKQGNDYTGEKSIYIQEYKCEVAQ